MNNEQIFKELYEKLKAIYEPTQPESEIKSKKWKPLINETYSYIDELGDLKQTFWLNDQQDNYLYDTGNCYPYTDEGKEQAIWEQVTRKKYETALFEAADWVEGDYFIAVWNLETKNIAAHKCYLSYSVDKPHFATLKSAIDAHTRILGDDAERYFERRR